MSKKKPTYLDEQAIANRAFDIWERDGRPEGRSDAHWAQAINELTKESTGKGSASRSKTSAKPKAAKPEAAKAAEKPKANAKSETTTKRTVSKKKS